jgi:hypothetical protein
VYASRLKVTTVVKNLLVLYRRHDERYGDDEEQTRGLADLLIDSGLTNMSQDRKDTGESPQLSIESVPASKGQQDEGSYGLTDGTVEVPAPTDEDIDYSAWAAEFEAPEEESDLILDAPQKDDINLVVALWAQHRYHYDPYLDKYKGIQQKRWDNFTRRRAEQPRAAGENLDANDYLVDNDHVTITYDEYYSYEEYSEHHTVDCEEDDEKRHHKRTRKRVCGKQRYVEALYEEEEDYDDECWFGKMHYLDSRYDKEYYDYDEVDREHVW